MKKLLIILVLIAAPALYAQNPAAVVRFGSSDPALCKPAGPNIFLNTTSGLLKFCSAANTWASAGGGTVPVTYSGATATNTILTLKTTDDNTTNPLLKLNNSGGSAIAQWGATGRLFVPVGTAALPTLTNITNTTDGFWFRTAGLVDVTNLGTTTVEFRNTPAIVNTAGGAYSWSSGAPDTTNPDTFLTRSAAATVQQGAADTSIATAQTTQVQSVLTGTSNTAGADWTLIGSKSTGTGAGGKIIFKASGAGNIGTAVNTANTILTLADAGTAGTSAPVGIFATGSTAQPSIAFSGATTTGLFVSGGSMRISTAGVLTEQLDSSGVSLLSNTECYFAGASADAKLCWRAAANWQLGAADSAAPVAQTLSSQSATGTNIAAPSGGTTIASPLGTGNAAGDQLNLNRGLMQTTGMTQHTSINAITVCESKTLSNTSATTTTLATISSPNNSGGGFVADISVVATDGTNFDVETQTVTDSWVNKAGTYTIGAALITASTAASNSGSTTIGATVTGASTSVSIKVTPVFTTIVPTTVTAYINVHNLGAGNVTCQ